MPKDEYITGIDWGGRDQGVGIVMKVDGEAIGVVSEFKLTGTQTKLLKELGAPKDFIMRGRHTGTAGTLEKMWINEEWFHKTSKAPEVPKLNRAQRRARKK